MAPHEVIQLAMSSNVADRIRVATLYEFEGPMLESLARDEDATVRSTAIRQRAASPELLEEVVRLHPEHEDEVVHHPHAPLHLLGRLPIAHAAAPGQLDRYLDDKDADDATRRRFRAIRREQASAHRDDLSLDDVWRAVARAAG